MANMSSELPAIQDPAFMDTDVDAQEAMSMKKMIRQDLNQSIVQAKAALTRKERANEAISDILILMDAYSDLSSKPRLSTEAKNEIVGALKGTKLVTKADFYEGMRKGMLTTRKKVLKAMTQAKEELLQRDKVHFWKAEIKQLRREKRMLEILRDICELRCRIQKRIWLVNI
ncbi:MAG: hypothetical protein Q9184_008380, partial [Pyrenodesmia sp. 2 TL-2023]